MEAKPDPRSRPMLVTLLVLSPLVLASIHWLLMHLPQLHMQAAPFVRPDCVCPSTAAASAALAPQAQLRQHRLPWRPWLSQVEARRGVAYSGSGAALRRLAAKLLAGQPVSIVSIGGSVTYQGGPEPNGQSYIAGIFQYINASFPHRQHKMQNEGMPSWGSDNFEPCVESFVPEDADLVVAEFAHNDRATVDLPPFERLLRRLLQLPSKPAVLLLEFYPWWMSFGDGVLQGRFNRQPEIDQTVLGQYYDVPVVSLRAAAWRLMHAGIEGFKVDKVTEVKNQYNMGNRSQVVPMANAAEKQAFLYRDIAHLDLSKVQVLAELAIQPLAMAVEEVAAGVVLQDRQDERLQGLPPPMTAGTRDGAGAICYTLEAFKPLVKDVHGFEFRPERPEARTFRQQKWGWSGLQPGDWAELEVDTEQLGVASPVRHALVGFVHLTSPNVTNANVTCISGCSCEPIQITARQPIPVSVLKIRWMIVTRHPRCRIRVEIIDDQTPDAGHKFMLAALMVRAITE